MKSIFKIVSAAALAFAVTMSVSSSAEAYRGGFHGGYRGGFHGGYRGGFHGGYRGGYRGYGYRGYRPYYTAGYAASRCY